MTRQCRPALAGRGRRGPAPLAVAAVTSRRSSRGIYTDSLIRMLRQINDHGASHALISVDPANIPSIKAIERVGFRPLYRLTVSQRFGRTRRHESAFQARFQTQA